MRRVNKRRVKVCKIILTSRLTASILLSFLHLSSHLPWCRSTINLLSSNVAVSVFSPEEDGRSSKSVEA